MSIACREIEKKYAAADEPVLTRVTLDLRSGDTAVVIGPSGSGKTTLLSILGCLLSPTAGDLSIASTPVHFDDRRALERTRREKIGFVFQHAQLLPFLSVGENVRLVARNAGASPERVEQRVAELADALRLTPLLRRKPGSLSGGERQRAAIARALVHDPAIVLADEPTAALDWRLRDSVAELLIAQATVAKSTVVVVTHDDHLVPLFRRVFYLEGGELREAS